MLDRLSTPRFWIPGWRQALVFALLIVLGLLAWGMGTAPMGTAPFLGGSPEDRPFDFGFPFYLGTNLYVLFAVSAGFFFPRCFYLWGAALLTLYPFADVAHFLWLELVAGFDVVRGGAYGWLGVATVATVFAIINASIATVLAAVGVCLRLGVHRLKTGEW